MSICTWSAAFGKQVVGMVPPKGSGPMVEAVPGLRSKSTPPSHCAGKKAQEWCEGELVSKKGMPSKSMSYSPKSAKPREVKSCSGRVQTPSELVCECAGNDLNNLAVVGDWAGEVLDIAVGKPATARERSSTKPPLESF